MRRIMLAVVLLAGGCDGCVGGMGEPCRRDGTCMTGFVCVTDGRVNYSPAYDTLRTFCVLPEMAPKVSR